jgi:hypothetical protein
MRKSLFAIVVLAIVGCEGIMQPELVDSSGRLVDRTYRMTSCQATFFTDNAVQPVPCTSYSSPHAHSVADSGRLILRPDGSAQWMIGTTETDNPCYLSGQSCPTTSSWADTSSATYRIAKDSVVVHLHHVGSNGEADLVFLGPVPDQVTSRWAGPDSVTFNLSNGAYLGIFKP